MDKKCIAKWRGDYRPRLLAGPSALTAGLSQKSWFKISTVERNLKRHSQLNQFIKSLLFAPEMTQKFPISSFYPSRVRPK